MLRLDIGFYIRMILGPYTQDVTKDRWRFGLPAILAGARRMEITGGLAVPIEDPSNAPMAPGASALQVAGIPCFKPNKGLLLSLIAPYLESNKGLFRALVDLMAHPSRYLQSSFCQVRLQTLQSHS